MCNKLEVRGFIYKLNLKHIGREEIGGGGPLIWQIVSADQPSTSCSGHTARCEDEIETEAENWSRVLHTNRKM